MEKEKIDINSPVTGFVIEENFDSTAKTQSDAKPTSKVEKKAKPEVSNNIATKLPKSALKVKVKNTGFKSLGNIIKVIAFLVAIAVIFVHVIAAYLLFAFRPLYLAVCIGIVAFGLVVSLILLFLIYALGQILNQNYEILTILKSKDKK